MSEMTTEERTELEKQAQTKLSDARRLIREAGELAKQGQFYLSFGEIGDFIPTKLEETYRDDALAILKKEGRDNGSEKILTGKTNTWGQPVYDYVVRPATPFEQLTSDEVEFEVDRIARDYALDEVGHDTLEYADRDRWWHPSRC